MIIDVIGWLLPIQPAIQSFRTNDLTNNFTVAVSVSGNATAILSSPLFNANTSLVSSVSSNNTADTPLVAGYDTISKTLTVAGLSPSETAILTVRYFTDAFPNQPVWADLLNIAPYFFILVLIILPVVAIVLFIREVRSRAT